tara:strand:- start:212 stop:928 length:717 start_codon:yes stop_codon:yes gene_type:complete
MKTVIYTIVAGNAQEYAQYCIPSIAAYAKKIGSDFVILTEEDKDPAYPTNHFIIYEAFKQFENSDYDQMAFMDADIIINPSTPSIFEEFKEGFWVRQGWDWAKVAGYIHQYFGIPKRMFPRYFSSGIVVSTKKEIKEVNQYLHAPWHIGPWGGDQGQLNYALTECSFNVNILPYRWHFTRGWARESDAWKFGGDLMGAVREAGCERLEEIYCMHYAGGEKVQQILNDREFLHNIGIQL